METLIEFWQLVVEVWDETAFGTSFGRIFIAVLVFVVFLLGRKLFSYFVVGWLRRMAQRTMTSIDDVVLECLERPLRFVPIVLGFFVAVQVLDLPAEFDAIAERITRSLIVFTLFWGVVSMVEPLRGAFGIVEEKLSPTLADWLIKAIKAAFVVVGAAAVLDVWGIEIGPVLAGLGLFGLAGALAAQDLLKNLLSGILVLAEQRFQIGDWIHVDGVVEGTVESIGFRSTQVRRFDKALVQVPNTKLADNAVTNFTAMSHRRIYWKIGVLYSTTAGQLRTICEGIERYIHETEDFARPDEVATFVRVDSFNDSSIDIMVYCFTNTTVWGEWLAVKEQLAYRIKQIVEEAGSGFAFPSRSLYVEALPGDAPELFVPPAERETAG